MGVIEFVNAIDKEFVQAVLAVGLILGLVAMVALQIPVPEGYWGVAGSVVGYFFGGGNGKSNGNGSNGSH